MSDDQLGDTDNLALGIRHLAEIIDERALVGDEAASYTAKLLDKGPLKCAKKLIEEAGEFGLAVAAESDAEIAGEAADVIYHMFVALRSRGVSLEAVAAALIRRQGMSGLAEKAARDT